MGAPFCATKPFRWEVDCPAKTKPAARWSNLGRGGRASLKIRTQWAGLLDCETNPILRNSQSVGGVKLAAQGLSESLAVWRRATAPSGELENTNPMGGICAKMRTATTSVANLYPRWAIPADKNGPKNVTGVPGRPAILSVQVTVGRRLEHLATRKNWRLPRRVLSRHLSRLPYLPDGGRSSANRKTPAIAIAESWFENSVARGPLDKHRGGQNG
jgi:hypothetical protein